MFFTFKNKLLRLKIKAAHALLKGNNFVDYVLKSCTFFPS